MPVALIAAGHAKGRYGSLADSDAAAAEVRVSGVIGHCGPPGGAPRRRPGALPGRPPRRPGAEEAEAGGVPRIAEARAVAGNLNLKLGAQRGPRRGPRASG